MNKLALLVWLAACGGGKDPADRCAATVDKVMGKPSGDGWARKSDAEKQKAIATRAEVAKTVTESCRTLKWSAEMHDCIDKAEDSKAGLSGCDGLLTTDQIAAVKDALMPKAAAVDERALKDATTAVAEAEAKLLQLEQDRRKVVDELQVISSEVQAAKTKQSREDSERMMVQLEALLSTMDEGIAKAKAEVARAKRRKGVTLSKECLDNPLAKGCN